VAELLPEERETHLNMTGDNHNEWIVFTDDPYWIRRLDKVATATRIVGGGKEYRLPARQLTLRAKRKEIDDATKKIRAANLRQFGVKTA
jgi:hypothetical protein